jgi:hypothetical protein
VKRLIYLASPYTHDDETVRTQRFWQACAVAGRLMREGHKVFSPIAHSHPIALCGGLPTHWEFWKEYDEAVLESCSELWILTLPGYLESTGVAAETAIAEALGLPVRYVEPTEDDLREARLCTAAA